MHCFHHHHIVIFVALLAIHWLECTARICRGENESPHIIRCQIRLANCKDILGVSSSQLHYCAHSCAAAAVIGDDNSGVGRGAPDAASTTYDVLIIFHLLTFTFPHLALCTSSIFNFHFSPFTLLSPWYLAIKVSDSHGIYSSSSLHRMRSLDHRIKKQKVSKTSCS